MTPRGRRIRWSVRPVDPALPRRLRQSADGGLLRAPDQFVDGQVLGARLAHEQRPRHVAPVAGDLGAEVE
jgi:hypothetical protein